MKIRADEIVPWHERAFVTAAEAGIILSRSQSWVRDQIVAGVLMSASLPGRGPTAVTVSSVLALVERARPVHEEAEPTQREDANTTSRARHAGKPLLRLVVDNT
jgi:hypothetical protein